MKKILFFTPYGGRSGSEMLLWYILNNFDRKLFKAELFCNQTGELLNLLPKDIKSHVLRYSLTDKVLSRINKSSYQNKSLYEKQIISIHNQFKPDYWYLNTIKMAEIIPIAQKLKVKVISHFHELPPAYEMIKSSKLEYLVNYSDAIIGCSEIVCEKVLILGNKNVYLQYEFIDTSKVFVQENKTAQIREKLNINKGDFVWVLSGARVFNKGIDILPEIVKPFDKENTHFVWLGGSESGLSYYVEKQMERNGIRNVHFVGAQKEDYYDYLALGNAFLLLSRADSFPLVMIEAAHLEKPIAAFNSGGVKEFVLEGMGKVVDSWNTIDLINEMKKIMTGETKIDKKILKNRAAEFCVTKQIDNWQKTMQDIVDSKN